jgi:predicted RNA-binding Zn ribbon-like protein
LPRPLPNQWGLEPCLDLINTRWTDHVGGGAVHDRLPLPVWRRGFIKHWKLHVENPDDPHAVRRLLRLRTLLRQAMELYIDRGRLTPTMRSALEGEINRAPLLLRIRESGGKDGLLLERAGRDWDIVTAEIATSALRLISEGHVVKVCANPNCTWMFVDESRASSRRWCEVSICGSLINVRRHRGSAQPTKPKGGASQ